MGLLNGVMAYFRALNERDLKQFLCRFFRFSSERLGHANSGNLDDKRQKTIRNSTTC